MRSWAVRAIEISLLVPSFLPPLFILLVVLSFVEPFPTGLAGVILIHSLMNAGLVCLFLKSMIESKARPLLEISFVQGLTQVQFFRASLGMFRRDLFSLFIFVFILCFTSFSIPLIAGGGRATTLEILIYEKIRISGAWDEALSLSFIQLVFLMILSLIPFAERRQLFGRGDAVPLLGSFTGVVALLTYGFGFLGYFGVESIQGWSQVFRIPGLWQEALGLLPDSFILGISVGLMTLCFLLLTAWQAPFSSLHRLIVGFVSPSTALLGFSFLFFLPNEEPWNKVKWVVGFSYLVFSTLYRWGWDKALSGLSEQAQVAKTLGASQNLIFTDILFPQVIAPAARIASVASFWALGDFALGKILIGRDATLSLLIETLMSSYRLQAAMALMGLVLVLGALSFAFFGGIAYVAHRTSE